MPNVQLTDAMQDYADRMVKVGAYANVSEVVRAGMRKLMDDEGALAFYQLRKDLERRATEPGEDVDIRALLARRESD
jgi:antitoxin ParD1/3/4